MSTNRTRTSTFIHRNVNGENVCHLIGDSSNNDDAVLTTDTDWFQTSSSIHVDADSIGRAYDFSEPMKPAEAVRDDGDRIVVKLDQVATLFLDVEAARKLAKFLNAAARAAEKAQVSA